LAFGIDWDDDETITRINNALINYRYAKDNHTEIYTKSFLDQNLVVRYETQAE